MRVRLRLKGAGLQGPHYCAVLNIRCQVLSLDSRFGAVDPKIGDPSIAP